MTVESPYYYGSAENKLNSKGQVAIPARLRAASTPDDHGKTYVIIRGEGSCLYMYTYKQFAGIKDNARRVAEETGDGDFFREFMAEAYSADIDTQGRFVLPQAHMDAVGIRGPSILFIGVDDRIEIWEPGVYAESKHSREKYESLRRSAARKIFGI